MTGIKDLDLNLLMEMDDRELLTICASKNKYIYRICNDENFWQKRFVKRFGIIAANSKPVNHSWKSQYMHIIIDLDRFANDPWSFLRFVLWSPKGIEFSKYMDNNNNIEPFAEAPEWVKNNFYFLNLGPVTVNNISYPSMTPQKLFELETTSLGSMNMLVNGY